MCLVPNKKPGEFRVIHHLSYPEGTSINDGISKDPCIVQYQTIDDAIKLGKRIPTLLIQQNVLQENLCPVKSLWEYIQLWTVDKVNTGKPQPLFFFMDNSPISRPFSTQQLQLSLKYIGLSWRNYKTSSFRIGTVTTASAIVISEEKNQQMGRWHSKAFKKYIRIPILKIKI